jgi:hypothetical protein
MYVLYVCKIFLSVTHHLQNPQFLQCVYCSEMMGLWTLSLIQNFKYKRKQHLGNWICFRPQIALLDPLERANLNHWTSHQD